MLQTHAADRQPLAALSRVSLRRSLQDHAAAADTRRVVARRVASLLGLLIACFALPVVTLVVAGGHEIAPPAWLHFWGVGVTALAATIAALALTVAGVRQQDTSTVVIGGGFAVMASLMAVHGLATPGVVVGRNSVVALTGAASLPVGGAVLVLSAWPQLARRVSIATLVRVQAVACLVVAVIGMIALAAPTLLPAVPAARSAPAQALMVVGVVVYVALAIRPARTYLLTRRGADLIVVIGLAMLAVAVWAALMLDWSYLGWWLGHALELVGITLVGSSVAYDLRRGRRSRPLAGDLRATEIVAAEEAFLGAHVRALMVRLAEKDASTEEHTRRVATLAVEVGEELNLPPARLRALAIGGLLHDIGKLSTPTTILQKPGPLTDHEYDVIKLHPEHGSQLISGFGGFDNLVRRLVSDHHERLDGGGYPRGLNAGDLPLETRILTVSDVFDALVSPRVYRPAWPTARAVSLLRDEQGAAFDERCVDALCRILDRRGDQSLPLAS
jgi:putative nucleotidyltransferase with HDIG domain